jgi:HlyD family secretion protein
VIGMLRLLANRRLWIAVAVVGGLIAVALWPETIPVDVAMTGRGPLVVTVDEEGRTRVRDRFVVSAPVTGRVLRIELEPGDSVTPRDVVARVRAETPPLLDARSRAEAEAAVESARAALGRARAEEQRASTAAQQARRELVRVRELQKSELTTQREIDNAVATAQAADEAHSAATFAVRAAQSELVRAQARIEPSSPDIEGRVVEIRSPVAGMVLKRLRESESVVPAGEPLVEIGDPNQLEIVADLLSTDAVRVKSGARAIVEQWGGARELAARVRRVEPSGFTKISALGVEEQRVNVILDFVDPVDAWKALGDAYRVEVRIVIWEAADVLKVPTSALFRDGEAWAVYVVEGGRARKTTIELGHQAGQEAEVVSGLAEGTVVIEHPGDTLTDGARVAIREPL